jgi:hypothetical protein
MTAVRYRVIVKDIPLNFEGASPSKSIIRFDQAFAKLIAISNQVNVQTGLCVVPINSNKTFNSI